MGIRDVINRHPALAMSFAAVGVGVVLAVIFLRPRPAPPAQPKAFYTTDDGATLFYDDLGKVPPFDHDGKPAVRAFVFTCDDGKTQIVQYLETYSDAVKRRMDTAQSRTQLGMGRVGAISPQ